MKTDREMQRPRERSTTTLALAAGVCEGGERGRDHGLSSANYSHQPAPVPYHWLRCHTHTLSYCLFILLINITRSGELIWPGSGSVVSYLQWGDVLCVLLDRAF